MQPPVTKASQLTEQHRSQVLLTVESIGLEEIYDLHGINKHEAHLETIVLRVLLHLTDGVRTLESAESQFFEEFNSFSQSRFYKGINRV